MFDFLKNHGAGVARLASIGLISAACVVHYNKPPADGAAHALGPAGHGAPPGLTEVSLARPAPEPN